MRRPIRLFFALLLALPALGIAAHAGHLALLKVDGDDLPPVELGNADGRRLASASADETVRLWDGESGAQQRVLPGYTGLVQSVAWSPDWRNCRLWLELNG